MLMLGANQPISLGGLEPRIGEPSVCLSKEIPLGSEPSVLKDPLLTWSTRPGLIRP